MSETPFAFALHVERSITKLPFNGSMFSKDRMFQKFFLLGDVTLQQNKVLMFVYILKFSSSPKVCIALKKRDTLHVKAKETGK